MDLIATRVVRDEGTVVVFAGRSPDQPTSDRELWFAVDHRMAQPIADAIALDEEPLCSVESWQIVGIALSKETS